MRLTIALLSGVKLGVGSLNCKVKIIPAALFLCLAGCEQVALPPDAPALTADSSEIIKSPVQPDGAQPSLSSVAADISAREAAYEQVIKDARSIGMVNGALRGAIVGLLIDSSAAGAAAGAAVGGVIGYSIGDQTGSRIVQSHRNFLLREDSLRRVIKAAKNDTSNTRFDLLLASDFAATAHGASAKDQETVSRARQSLLGFREFAMSRVVALQEVIPIYGAHPDVQSTLREELTTQKILIGKYDMSLKSMVEKEQ